MIYFHDLLQNDGFRSFVQKRIASHPGNEGYAFPSSFPPLYRYRSLSEYAINDIVQDQFTLTSIGEFNDLFDGAFHMAYTQEECKRQAADEWNERKKISLPALARSLSIMPPEWPPSRPSIRTR